MPWINELMNATLLGLHGSVLELLEDGHSPDGPGDLYLTPLHIAILNNDFKMTKLLIEHGANIELRSHAGCTPIYTSLVDKIDIKIMELLLSLQARLDVKDMLDRTPLHAAAQFSKCEKIRRLFESSRDCLIDATDYFGNTAFHYALKSKKLRESDVLKIIELFARLQADINVQDLYGHTVLHLAVGHRYSMPIMTYMMTNCPSINWSLKCSDGQNFLHYLFNKSHQAEQIFGLLIKSVTMSLADLKMMLKEKDHAGLKAFSIYLERSDCRPEIVKIIKSMVGEVNKCRPELQPFTRQTFYDTVLSQNKNTEYLLTSKANSCEIHTNQDDASIPMYMGSLSMRTSLGDNTTSKLKYGDENKVSKCVYPELLPFPNDLGERTFIETVQYRVLNFVKKVARTMGELDTRFTTTLQQISSIPEVADDIKTFDFAFCLSSFSDVCEIDSRSKAGCLFRLRTKDFPPPREYAYFVDSRRLLLPYIIHDTFSRLLRISLTKQNAESLEGISLVSKLTDITLRRHDQQYISFSISLNSCYSNNIYMKINVFPVIRDDKLLPWTLHADDIQLSQMNNYIKKCGALFNVSSSFCTYFPVFSYKFDMFED